MAGPWREFKLSDEMRGNLARRLSRKDEIFSIASDPLFASLISCLGLQFEVGRHGWDRLSPALGLDLGRSSSQHWQSQIISHGDAIGIRFFNLEVDEFQPRHEDFREILHPLSLDSSRNLSQIVIFPHQVAQKFAARGFELVIVRDWAQTVFLPVHAAEPVPYQITNRWEVETNAARLQCRLLVNSQFAFSGTHDLVDHLLGAKKSETAKNLGFFREIQNVFERVFPSGSAPKNRSLVTAYLIGVLLDDLAQPINYASEGHLKLLRESVQLLLCLSEQKGDRRDLEIPPAFHAIMETLRTQKVFSEELFSAFASQVQ